MTKTVTLGWVTANMEGYIQELCCHEYAGGGWKGISWWPFGEVFYVHWGTDKRSNKEQHVLLSTAIDHYNALDMEDEEE